MERDAIHTRFEGQKAHETTQEFERLASDSIPGTQGTLHLHHWAVYQFPASSVADDQMALSLKHSPAHY
jgi:hypothetical protein